MRKGGKILQSVISVALIAVLFLVILTLVVFSALTYQKAVEIQDGNSNARAVLTYVTTAVKASSGSEITLEERDGVQVLAISDGDSGYEQQIFFLDGQVLETYRKAGSVPTAEDALVIGSAETFEMKLEKDDLLEVRTDLGSSYVHIQEK